MREAARHAFIPFTAPLEGVVPFMYLDVKGLVTTAIGNLIDSPAEACALPWKWKDGRVASKQDVIDEWNRVKAAQDMKMRGGMAYKGITNLRLDSQGIEQVVSWRLRTNEEILLQRFPAFARWPSDAQLATHSLAWACGPHFRFPLLERALRAEDFSIASLECHMNETGNPGLKPRNVANKIMYRNAGRVMHDSIDPEPLYWPRDLAQGGIDRDAPTLRALPVTGDEDTEPAATVHPDVPLPERVYTEEMLDWQYPDKKE